MDICDSIFSTHTHIDIKWKKIREKFSFQWREKVGCQTVHTALLKRYWSLIPIEPTEEDKTEKSMNEIDGSIMLEN